MLINLIHQTLFKRLSCIVLDRDLRIELQYFIINNWAAVILLVVSIIARECGIKVFIVGKQCNLNYQYHSPSPASGLHLEMVTSTHPDQYSQSSSQKQYHAVLVMWQSIHVA